MKQATFIATICLVVLIVIAVILIFDIDRPSPPSYASIASFEECVAAGYPIIESYPPQCTTPDGRTFTQSNIATSTIPVIGQGSSTAPITASASSTSTTSAAENLTHAPNHIIKTR